MIKRMFDRLKWNFWLKMAIETYKKYRKHFGFEKSSPFFLHKDYGEKKLAIIIFYGNKNKVLQSYKNLVRKVEKTS